MRSPRRSLNARSMQMLFGDGDACHIGGVGMKTRDVLRLLGFGVVLCMAHIPRQARRPGRPPF